MKRSWFAFLCRVTFCSILTVIIVYLFIMIGRAHWTDEHTFTTCFNVDLLEHHVPNREPIERRHPPLTLGEICFNVQEPLVSWRFREGYSNYYQLTDLTLRGPLPFDPAQPQRGPVVEALGISRRHGHHAPNSQADDSESLEPHELAGMKMMSRTDIHRVLAHPRHYYLSLEGVDEGRPHEIARHRLDQPLPFY